MIRTRVPVAAHLRVSVSLSCFVRHSYSSISLTIKMSNQSLEIEENSDEIVDIDILEASKENIQPLKAGRRVTTLSAVFSTPHHQRDAQLSSIRAQLRAEVEEAKQTNNDPLSAYVTLVYWTIEHYPQGHSAESGILELLEEATRSLKDDERYKDDLRYLKLWVLYANYIERPTVIYAFLLANNIGTTHALLYEEFAIVLERDGKYVILFHLREYDLR